MAIWIPWAIGILLQPLWHTADETAIVPGREVAAFNGKNLDGLTTWLKESKADDPKKVFRVTDGQLHISGEGNGYIATAQAYRNYRVVIEYKWGKKTDGGKYVRNSGLLLHITGPDGSAGGTWPACIECQLAQGCNGDLICIRGKDAASKVIPVELTSDIEVGPDKKPRWKEGGQKQVFTGKQLWWKQHDPDFKELIDTRGKNDVESPLGEYTKVECICKDKTISVKINGQHVNEAYNVFPGQGRIAIQSEGFELWVKSFTIYPLDQK